jgi:hypothetical protein
MNSTSSRAFWPTRKWWAALITALAAFLINWIQAGQFSREIAIALVGVLAQAAVAYVVPNQDTPGGVPGKK